MLLTGRKKCDNVKGLVSKRDPLCSHREGGSSGGEARRAVSGVFKESAKTTGRGRVRVKGFAKNEKAHLESRRGKTR